MNVENELKAAQWLRRRRMAPVWGIAIGLAALLVYWPGIVGVLPGLRKYCDARPLQTVDLRVGDVLHRAFVSHPSPKGMPKVCVIGITAEALAAYGPMPWPGKMHADLVRRLQRGQASVIAFDLSFSGSCADDAEFAGEIRRAGNVILPQYGIVPQPVSSNGLKGEGPASAVFERGARLARVARSPDGVFRVRLCDTPSRLYDESAESGHINILYDDDLVARRIPAAIGEPGKEKYYLPLGVVAAVMASGTPPNLKLESGALRSADLRVPLDGRGCIVINYPPSPKDEDIRACELRQAAGGDATKVRAPIEFYSYLDVLDGRIPEAAFKGAVVLVGQCVSGPREDLHPTPEGDQYGVLVQAMLAHTVLSRQFLSPVSRGWTVLLMLLFSIGLGTACFGLRFRRSGYVVVAGGLLALGVAAALTLCIAGLLRQHGLMLDVTPFLIVAGLNLAGGVWVNVARIAREVDRRSLEMDLLLVAGRRHMFELTMDETPRAGAIPGSSQIAFTASLSMHSPEIVAETFWETIPCDGCALFLLGQGETLTLERTAFHGFSQRLSSLPYPREQV